MTTRQPYAHAWSNFLSVTKAPSCLYHQFIVKEMATKKITQQMFDDIVRENIVDFGMSAKEAIEDACKQLIAQVPPHL